GGGAGGEAVAPRGGECPHDLAHAGGADVGSDGAVSAPDARHAGDRARRHELVGLARLVGAPDGRDGIGGGVAHAVHHRVVGDLGARPALVPVHRVVAAHHGRAAGPPAVLTQQVDQLLHEREGRLGRRVAPVEPGVDRHGQLVQVAEHDPGGEVLVERVHAAVSDQTQQVERAAATPHLAAQLRHRRQPEERPRLDRLGDAHDVLGHDAPGPEIQVSHFAVADLSLGQAHRESGRVEQRARRSRPETMPGGCIPQLDGVPLPSGTEPPAVEHAADERGGTLGAGTFRTTAGPTASAGHDLAGTRAPEENLRSAPAGALVGKLPQGFLLNRVAEATTDRWVHVTRSGWVEQSDVEALPQVASARTDTGSGGPTPGPRPGVNPPDTGLTASNPVDPSRLESARRTVLYRAPEGPPAGTLAPAAPLRVLGRSGEWTRVQLEGWV